MSDYDVVVVGGGGVGLSTAYHLAKKGLRVCILEKNYLGSGSSTRNAGGFRVHFKAEENVRYMVAGRKKLLSLPKETGWNVTPITGGYFWVLHNEQAMQEFRELNRMWAGQGVPGQLLGGKEVKERLPTLELGATIGGFFGPQDGGFHHDLVVFGYQAALRRLRVDVREYSPVDGIILEGDKVTGAKVGSREIRGEKLVICAGAWTPALSRLAGVDIPISAERREIGVTEPIKFFLSPFVIIPSEGVYFAQGLRGEIRGTVTDLKTEGLVPLVSTYAWTVEYARRLLRVFPGIAGVRFNRQWSGYYEMTPDHSHIMGRGNAWPEGLYVAAGFSGHGMMMSPITGELMAEHVSGDATPQLMLPFSPDRFAEGRPVRELMVF